MKTKLCVTLALVSLCVTSLAQAAKPVKVYILAGQSNMEGKGRVALAEYQAKQPATDDLYKHLRDGDQWIERDDVLIKFLDRKGKLTAGFGSPGCIGPELEFGQVMGEHFEEPVLLIKTAWGGRSLQRDFRSPSAGLPDDATLEKLLEQERKRKPDATLDDVKKTYGATYREMIAEVKQTLANLDELFPELAGQKTELAGLVWFQGWNDMINPEATAEYTSNLAHFIRDVRKDLGVENLPVVVGEMGVGGEEAADGVKRFKAAQAAILELPEFQGNVAVVKTDVFWDKEADAVFKKGWKNHVEEWKTVGSDFPFHYLGSARTHVKMGRAFGEAMLGLSAKK